MTGLIKWLLRYAWGWVMSFVLALITMRALGMPEELITEMRTYFAVLSLFLALPWAYSIRHLP